MRARGCCGERSKVAKEQGKPKSQVFREAVEVYLRLYRFRKLQAKMQARYPAPGGARGEEDVEPLVQRRTRRPR